MAKRNGKFGWFSAALLFLAICSSAMAEDPGACTLKTVAGTYAVSIRGTVIMHGPGGSVVPAAMASLGIATIDLRGTISINGYQSIGGQVSQTQMTGTITVNSDCTASADFGDGTTETLVIIGNGADMRSLTLAVGPLRSPITFGNWKRISPGPNTVMPNQCAPRGLAGVYAYQSSGTVILTQPPGPIPVATLGVGSVNRDGAVSANVTASIAGQIVPLVITAASPINVSSNCTATVTFNVTSQGAPLGQHQDFLVVLDGGRELWDLTIKDFLGQSVEFGTWTIISPVLAASN
jgi:hypothetical protein